MSSQQDRPAEPSDTHNTARPDAGQGHGKRPPEPKSPITLVVYSDYL